MNTAEKWPTVWVVPPAEPLVEQRRAIAEGAVKYGNAVQRITMLLLSSAAALVDHDYVTAERDRHEAFEAMRKLSEMIDDTEREVCLPTDGCDQCGSPSSHRCECDDDIPFAARP